MKAFITIFLITMTTSVFALPEENKRDANLFRLLNQSGRLLGQSGQLQNEILEQLQNEVQQLRGIVEEQAYEISTLEKNQQARYLDFDQRLQRLTKADESINTDDEPATITAETKLAKPTGVLGIDFGYTVEPPQALPDETAMPIKLDPPSKTALKTQSLPRRISYKRPIAEQKQAYQQAYGILRQGQTVQAITLFKQFLQYYPRGEYADQASYWLAESYRLNQQIDQAQLTFQKLITQFANSPKVPDAKLKFAFIKVEAKHYTQAIQLLEEIVTNYPDTRIAYLAAKKLTEISAY